MANFLCIHIPGEVFQSSEGYLEPSRASGIKRFLEKIAGSFFLQKSSIIDVRLGSQYASGVVLLYSICVIRIQHNHQNFLQKECSFQQIYRLKSNSFIKPNSLNYILYLYLYLHLKNFLVHSINLLSKSKMGLKGQLFRQSMSPSLRHLSFKILKQICSQ